jgi:hypothetical protein
MSIKKVPNPITDIIKARNQARDRVSDWMASEGAAGRMRQNWHCLHWGDYKDAEVALTAAIEAEIAFLRVGI